MQEVITIVLVDDERFVLEQIRKKIDWEKMGIQVLGCFENAMDALESMINEIPDLLITDVKMPIMDGLELIKRTKSMSPSVECVVLSGYSEFAFAKTAMEYGVKHYLLKPFSKKEFESVLEKCKNQIQERRQKSIINLNERTELVKKLAWELKLLKENYDVVNIKMIQMMMDEYSDLSLLSSAVLYLVANFVGNNHSLLECVSGIFDKEQDIYMMVLYVLNELLCEDEQDVSMISKIKEYTKEHYQEESLNLQLIADNVAHWGVKYTGRRFFKETGIKYSDYLLSIRMEKAKELLKKHEHYTVENVAEKIGLGHNVPYFYQLFKRYTGMTPKEYKNE